MHCHHQHQLTLTSHVIVIEKMRSARKFSINIRFHFNLHYSKVEILHSRRHVRHYFYICARFVEVLFFILLKM